MQAESNTECFCPLCGGDGRETCDNPDHGFISAMSFNDIGRLGCPGCGHDPKHKVPNGGNCHLCEGNRLVSKKTAIEWCGDEAQVEYVEPFVWYPIEQAPRDGSLIDVACEAYDDDGEKRVIRLTDVAWHNANAIFNHTGWVRLTDDGDCDLVEGPPTCEFGLPAWTPTHFCMVRLPNGKVPGECWF